MKNLLIGLVVLLLYGCAPSLPRDIEQISPTSALLTWQIPTLNTDGTVLTDLKLMTIYFGTSPTLTSTGERIIIDSPYISSWTFTELTPRVQYYIVMTATNSQMNESQPSDVISFELSY